MVVPQSVLGETETLQDVRPRVDPRELLSQAPGLMEKGGPPMDHMMTRRGANQDLALDFGNCLWILHWDSNDAIW